MASCRHCGKDSGHWAFCTVCVAIAPDAFRSPAIPPKSGTLGRTEHNRRVRRALKYLQDVSPQEQRQEQNSATTAPKTEPQP